MNESESTDTSAQQQQQQQTTNEGLQLPDPATMKIKEIKNELNHFNVSYNDCFDKESLVQRLVDARNNPQRPNPTTTTEPTATTTGTNQNNESKSQGNDKKQQDTSTTSSKNNNKFDKEAKMQELKLLKVKELRSLCAQYNIRWGQMIEKDELITALIQHYESMSTFSTSGTIVPGQVSMITNGDILQQEIYNMSETPLLLDVFATWCGPCKLMSPQLDEAAKELGDSIRIAKIDSDKFPDWSNRLNVKGLPTLIVFDGKNPGKELQRVEGALMKDDLVRLARTHI
jgi:thioredoxin 1